MPHGCSAPLTHRTPPCDSANAPSPSPCWRIGKTRQVLRSHRHPSRNSAATACSPAASGNDLSRPAPQLRVRRLQWASRCGIKCGFSLICSPSLQCSGCRCDESSGTALHRPHSGQVNASRPSSSQCRVPATTADSSFLAAPRRLPHCPSKRRTVRVDEPAARINVGSAVTKLEVLALGLMTRNASTVTSGSLITRDTHRESVLALAPRSQRLRASPQSRTTSHHQHLPIKPSSAAAFRHAV
jgi:hypothetical protein